MFAHIKRLSFSVNYIMINYKDFELSTLAVKMTMLPSVWCLLCGQYTVWEYEILADICAVQCTRLLYALHLYLAFPYDTFWSISSVQQRFTFSLKWCSTPALWTPLSLFFTQHGFYRLIAFVTSIHNTIKCSSFESKAVMPFLEHDGNIVEIDLKAG